jgi:Ring finger domain
MNTVENARNHVSELLRLINIASNITENNPRGHIETLAHSYVQTLNRAQDAISILFNQKRDAIMERVRREQEQVIPPPVIPVSHSVQEQQTIDLTTEVVVPTTDVNTETTDTQQQFAEFAETRRRSIAMLRPTRRYQRQMAQYISMEERIAMGIMRGSVALRAQRQQKKIVFKSKALKKLDAESSMSTECVICYETPKMVDSCVTNCGHKFCSGCLNEWVDRKEKTSCPMCRIVLTRVDTFRIRKQPVRLI